MTAAPHLNAPWTWLNRFAALGPAFGTPLSPSPMPAPYWVAASFPAGELLGLPAGWHTSDEWLAVLTGNALLPGSQPLASVYSGHQFGQWAGQLGDGRAILLGEVLVAAPGPSDQASSPTSLEIQLKGAGRTPYSRMGDGRAVLRSSIREFLCSEAMHGLGIPTTRALCVTGSNAAVRREEIETAAVVTRVAPGFERFGHIEHFCHHDLLEELRTFVDAFIDRHLPACRQAPQPYTALLQTVARRTAELVAQWQAVGFCHGVMNTDNMSLLGLSIDYGPFQFLDTFDPGHICNHSDSQGRYAYDQQPNVAHWNLYALSQAMLPLLDDPRQAMGALEVFKSSYSEAQLRLWRAKLGLLDAQDDDLALAQDALALLANNAVDFTVFWRRLSEVTGGGDPDLVRDLFADQASLDAWLVRYQTRLPQDQRAKAAEHMSKTNPKFVLRNHLAEIAIRQAKRGDFSEIHTLLTLLQRPFDEHPGFEAYADVAPDWAAGIAISCSS